MISQAVATLAPRAIEHADYNNSFGTADPIYHVAEEAIAGSAGTHDTAHDSKFADPSQDFLAWGRQFDPGHDSWASVYAEIRKKNAATDLDRRYDWREFFTWVRAGFVPSNPALASAGN